MFSEKDLLYMKEFITKKRIERIQDILSKDDLRTIKALLIKAEHVGYEEAVKDFARESKN